MMSVRAGVRDSLTKYIPASAGNCNWQLATGNWLLATGYWLLATEFIVLRLARPEQTHERQERRCGQVVAHVVQAVLLREPCRGIWSERRAEDAGEVERERAPRVAHAGWEQLGERRAERAIRESHQSEARGEREHGAGRSGLQPWRERESEQGDGHRRPDQRPPPAVAIRQDCRERDRDREKQNSEQLNQQELLARVAERGRPPRQREDRHQVEEHECCERHQDSAHQGSGVVTQHDEHRQLHWLASLDRLPEHGCLLNPQ